MKNFSVRVTYTDRKMGPGTGNTINTKASSFHTAAKHGVRIFWDRLTRQQKNDIRRDGLNLNVREWIPLDKTTES